jgi:cytidylate kinase
MTSDRVLESLAQLNRFLEAQVYHLHHGEEPKPEPPSPISIAISRQSGARGAEVARAVGARLGWPVYDHELIDRIAQEKGLSSRLVKQLDERPVGWMEEAVRAFCSTDATRDGAYRKGLLQVLASLGEMGHCVIVGRGAAQVLPEETTLAVRLVAPRTFRIAEVSKRKGWSACEAQRWVDATDRERTLFVKKNFHQDADDPLGYDLVLNSRRLSLEECCELIVQAATARQRAGPAAAPAG